MARLVLRLGRASNQYQGLASTVFRSSSSRRYSASSSAKVDFLKHRSTGKPEPRSAKAGPLPVSAKGDEDPDESLDSDLFLLKVLKKEYKKALNAVEKYEVEIKGSFAPFELVPTEGSGDLTLRKQSKDEEILIKCILQVEEPEDYEYLLEDNLDALNIIQHLKLNIQFTKTSLGNETRFQLLCHYMSQSIEIDEIVYLDKASYVEHNYPYVGPIFSDLSEDMQQSFYRLMKERGIDASLADLAMDHLSSKYQDEYLRWVRNIRAFLKKKD